MLIGIPEDDFQLDDQVVITNDQCIYIMDATWVNTHVPRAYRRFWRLEAPDTGLQGTVISIAAIAPGRPQLAYAVFVQTQNKLYVLSPDGLAHAQGPVSPTIYKGVCPHCGAPAYVTSIFAECSLDCQNGN